jgi:hypothetical protein
MTRVGLDLRMLVCSLDANTRRKRQLPCHACARLNPQFAA